MTTPEQRFATLVEAFKDEPRVTRPADESHTRHKFGAGGLKVDDKIFAMLVRGSLVVKLPRERVAALIAAHAGDAFDRGQGRAMKEWVVIKPSASVDWLLLAREALAFVSVT